MTASEPLEQDADSANVRISDSCLNDPALSAYWSKRHNADLRDTPAAILERDSEPVAILRFFEDTGSTLALLDAQFVADVPRDHMMFCVRQLLYGTIRDARQRRCQRVRVLEPSSAAVYPGPLWSWPLSDTGFSQCATVSKWKPVGSEVDLSKSLGDTAEHSHSGVECELHQLGNHAYESDRIRQLVGQISGDSNDLIRLPKPNPDELMRVWRQKKVNVFIARSGDQDVGIVAWSTVQSEGLAEVSIDYLGVSPNGRRRGIARKLIFQALAQIESSNHGRIVDVSVMIDDKNSAAVKCYHRCGFRRTPLSFHVWLLELSDPPKAT